MLFYIILVFNLILLSSTNSLCSARQEEGVNNATSLGTIDILLLNISNGESDCQSDVINTAVESAVASHLSNPIFNFILKTTTQHIERDSKKVHSIFDKLFKTLVATPSIFAIIGPACSSIANIVADISHLLNIPLISQAPTFPNENRYKFTLLPSMISMMNGVARLLEEFPEWSKVVIISQQEEPFITSAAHLGNLLSINNVTATTNVILTSIHDINIQNIIVGSRRIVILITDSDYTKTILLKAAANIQHPYVWVTLSFHNKWWLNCQKDVQLHDFLSRQGVLSISNVPVYINCNTTSEHNSTQTENDWTFHLKEKSNVSLSTLAIDSVTSVLRAIHSTNLSQITANMSGIIRPAGKLVANEIQQTRFQGFSGDICFQDRMLPAEVFQLLQFKKGEANNISQLVKVGVINLREGVIFPTGVTRDSLWMSGIPSDGTPVTRENYPNVILSAVIYTFSSCNILLAIFGTVFMMGFRNRRLIRLSSPKLNCLIGIGVIIFNSSAFLYVYPPIPLSIINIFCGLRPWLVAIGYSLCLGTINTKMWRVYYIFRDPNPKRTKKPLKDWYLFCFVILFLLMDIIILSFATSFTSSRLQAVNIADIEHPQNGTTNTGIEIQYTVTLCDAPRRLYWIVILLGYKIFLHLTAVILTFKIKKVQVKVLNDSKEVVLILYLTGLVLAAVITMTFVFGSHLNIYGGTYAVGICVTSAVILCVVFVSKAVALCKDPNGEKLFPQSNEVPEGLGTCDEMREIATLQRKLKKLEAQLTFYNDTRDVDVETDVPSDTEH